MEVMSFDKECRIFNVKWKLGGEIEIMSSGGGVIRLEIVEIYARWRGISEEKAVGGVREQVEMLSGEHSTVGPTCDFTSAQATVAEGRTKAERLLYILRVCSDCINSHTVNFRYICYLARFVPIRIGRPRYCCSVEIRLVCCDCLRLTRNR
jgi:hypothetical protein